MIEFIIQTFCITIASYIILKTLGDVIESIIDTFFRCFWKNYPSEPGESIESDDF